MLEILILFLIFIVPTVWGGYYCFVRQPIVAALFLIFFLPALWVWGCFELWLRIIDTFLG